MYLFSFLLFPIVTFFKACSDYKRLGFEYLKSRFLVVLFGALSGCALCAIFEFCIFVPEYQGTDTAFFFVLQWIFSFFSPALFFVFFALKRERSGVVANTLMYVVFALHTAALMTS